MTAPRDIQEVAERHLCSGCGVCAYLAPEAFRIVDSADGYRRPLPIVGVTGNGASSTSGAADALAACPGAGLRHVSPLPPDHDTSVGNAWGPVLEVWEGWAADDEVRWRGSSGGAATALVLGCLEAGRVTGALHTRPSRVDPLANEGHLSRTRAELLAGAGSRYAPASPCEGLAEVESASGPSAFIGKPCDVAAAAAAAARRPELAAKLGLTIAVFCAGTPSSHGTREVLDRMGVDPDDVTDLSYRGRGWPGEFTATTKDGQEHRVSYGDSWGAVLQRHRQWRCMVCPDHTGEFADISVGDPWYREIAPGEPGRSLVVVRTERGRAAVRSAIASGHLVLERVPAVTVVASQPNLLTTRGAVWGRLLTMRVMRMPSPSYRRLPTFAAWVRLPLREKLRSTVGTARRVRQRGLRTARPVRPARESVVGERP